MNFNKIIRIVIASIFAFSCVYLSLVIRNVIQPNLEHFFREMMIWVPLFILSILGAIYVQKVDEEEKKKKQEKLMEIKEEKRRKRKVNKTRKSKRK